MSHDRKAEARRKGRPPTAPVNDERHVGLLKAMGDATRLRLLRLLHNEELNVQELCAILELPQPNVSRHLGVLRAASLVTDRREGTKVFYTLADPADERALFRDYLAAVGESDHPDMQRLEESLRARAQTARSFADSKAAQWDDIGSALHNTSASLLAFAGMIGRRAAVADLGTGTGLLLPLLSPMAETVYAVDQSGAMLRRARLRCRDAGIDNVSFVQKPLEELTVEMPACDALLLHFVLHQVARPPVLLSHLRQFLNPGGRLVIVDRVQHDDEQAKTTFGSLWLGFAKDQIGGWLAEAGYRSFSWQPVASATPVAEAPFAMFVAAAEQTAAPDTPHNLE